MRNLRPVVLVAAIAAALMLVCASGPSASQQNGQASPIRSLSAGQIPGHGVTSALEARLPPRASAVKPVRTVKVERPAAPAHAPPRTPTPPSTGGYHGSLRALVCSYRWSCAVAVCIVSRESGWNPRAYNGSSGAAGLWQFLPFHYRGRFDPFDPVAATRYAYALYRSVGWSPWHSGRHPCY